VTAAPPRPQALPVLADHIPEALRHRPRWVLWRYELRKGEWTKVPYNPKTGERADTTNPATLGSFAQTWTRYRAGGWDGIGYVPLPEDNLTGCDWDKCRDPSTSVIDPAVLAAVKRLGTYAEVSPSATGVRAFAFGRKPGRRCKEGNRELYDGLTKGGKPGGRFLSVTGHRLSDCPHTVNDRQAQIEALYYEVFGKPESPRPRSPNGRHGGPPPLTDQEILALVGKAKNANKFDHLYNGGLYGLPSASEADGSIAGILAFYTQDWEQIWRIIRGSKRDREKWSRADYAESTIKGAMAKVTKHYDPRRPRGDSGPGPDAERGDDGDEQGEGRTGYAIIKAHFLRTYRPRCRRRTTVVTAEGSEVRMGQACSGAGIALINELARALDAPRDRKGNVDRERLPWFFGNWCRSAWVDILAGLDEEEDAEEVIAPAEEEFREKVATALRSIVGLGHTYTRGKGEDTETVTDTQRRSLVNWCQTFAQRGQQWADVRSYLVWCRRDQESGNSRSPCTRGCSPRTASRAAAWTSSPRTSSRALPSATAWGSGERRRATAASS
jgi:hypothetical protein